MDESARAFLGRPGLARLWTAVRTRLERNGLQPTGSLRLQQLDPEEREALSLLLARQITAPTATIHLPDLDARLRAGAVGEGLAATLEQLGPPLTNRQAARDAASAERARLWKDAEAALAATPLAERPWARQWFEEVRRSGTLMRRGGGSTAAAATTLNQAIATLAALFADTRSPSGPWGRGELATRTTGSAHGLDDGTVLSRLVLRGLARACGMEPATDAAGRRALWRAASVAPDEVSSTVLTLGLRPAGGTWREAALRERADHRAETHLTLRELRALRLTMAPSTCVRICENPRVIEAAADAGRDAPLVCTSGSAATVVLTLLDALAEAGCSFRYHGDFDWPGITLANRILNRYPAAAPWRMAAADYEYLATLTRRAGTPFVPLAGTPVEASWDPELQPAMEALGTTLHEEAALDLLLGDLFGGRGAADSHPAGGNEPGASHSG